MSSHPTPAHGSLGYLQLPTRDVAASLAFYAAVLGWEGEVEFGSFTAPGLIGQWTPALAPAPASAGPVAWFTIEALAPALAAVAASGGRVLGAPTLDQGARWLVEVADPAGNRLGLVAPAPLARSQTMLAVADVEASRRWYVDVVGLVAGHGGEEYERLLADGQLVLQLHRADVPHDHGVLPIDPAAPRGNGVLVWLGEVSDFDAVLARVEASGAELVRPVHRNPAEGEGPSHREVWVRDPDGYVVVLASPDGEAWQG
ncbi:MAG: VOC family protein [Kineosporiaceae bacterium]